MRSAALFKQCVLAAQIPKSKIGSNFSPDSVKTVVMRRTVAFSGVPGCPEELRPTLHSRTEEQMSGAVSERTLKRRVRLDRQQSGPTLLRAWVPVVAAQIALWIAIGWAQLKEPKRAAKVQMLVPAEFVFIHCGCDSYMAHRAD